MGGFEGADHVNRHGEPLDMAHVTGHLQHLDADYARVASLGLCTVRESIGWRLTETQPGRFDFTRLRLIAQAARRHGVQVIWTLMHYGTPPDVDLLDDAMIDRFAAFAAAVARTLSPLSAEPPVLNLVNEIGFLAWAVSETAQIHPYRSDLGESGGSSTVASGFQVKRRLARAVLAGIDGVRQIDPRTRFLHVEPVVHVTAPAQRPELQDLADAVCAYQWQAWDLIGGLVEPGLGGGPEALDLIGVNHYHSGQWEVSTEKRLWWHLRDPRRRPLAALLAETHARYGRPMMIAETGHVGAGRAAWLHEVADEVGQARAAGIPVGGVCLYPLIDRPDWNDAAQWHHSGLWNVGLDAESDAASKVAPSHRRLLHLGLAAAIGQWQRRLPVCADHVGAGPRCLVVFPQHRWSDLPGRVEHVMGQLARDWRVVVVEPPLEVPIHVAQRGKALEPRLDRIVKGPGLEVLVPRLPASTPVDADIRMAIAGALLGEFIQRENIDTACVWFETPMPLPMLGHLGASMVLYDCNVECRAGADLPAWSARETALFRIADLVLTAAPRLQDRLSREHRNVEWVPDAVDPDRFRPEGLDFATEEADAVQRAQEHIEGLRLGYFGRIDERLDLALIAALADRRADWQLVMVGALDGIDPDRLPRRPNIHWLDAQAGGRAPYFAASWDVCLMPHAVGADTRAVCPTQALEFLAAEKPVVGTALPDVAHLFGRCIRVAHDHEAFIAACIEAVAEDPAARPTERTLRARAMVGALSWRRCADRVQRLIDETLGLCEPEPRPAGTGARWAVPIDS